MTNHDQTQCSHDAEEETHMQWLEENGFPAIRQLLTDQESENFAVLRSLPTGEALGVFHAVLTRDGEAQARDGQAFYAFRPLDGRGAEAIAEVQFGDGLWMLATRADLEGPSPQAQAEVAATSIWTASHFGGKSNQLDQRRS